MTADRVVTGRTNQIEGSVKKLAKKRNRQIRGSAQNILDVYNRASQGAVKEGTEWYYVANSVSREIGEMAGYSGDVGLFVGAGIISALSPQRDWNLNVQDARVVARGLTPSFPTGANLTKAERIRDGEHPLEVLGGLKVVPFYLAILDPRGENPTPVIDRHAGHVYKGDSLTAKEQDKLSNISVMTRIQGRYLWVAGKLGIHVHCLQGITWVQIRVEKGYATLQNA